VGNESVFPPERVTLVGVLNVTPDSFSDGGRLLSDSGAVSTDRVLTAADALLKSGAHILDVGGESTRPGAIAVSVEEEIERTAGVVEMLVRDFDVPISIDSRKAPVARSALAAGARIVNDISGLSHDPALAQVAAAADAFLVLGHIRGTPETMQNAPHYVDVLQEVASELEDSISRAREAGVPSSKLVVDPGIGFGKRVEDNLQLIAHAGWLRGRLGLPVMVGPSRKAFLGAITGDPVGERDLASHAACAVAAFAGADAVRVHDAAGASRAVAVGRAMAAARRKDLT
jgi:dihydropteroate synthase